MQAKLDCKRLLFLQIYTNFDFVTIVVLHTTRVHDGDLHFGVVEDVLMN